MTPRESRDKESLITPERESKRILDEITGGHVPDMDLLRANDGRVIWGRSKKWPLDYYFNSGHIKGSQHRAGCDYHRLWRDGVIQSGHAMVKYEVRSGGNTPYDASLRTEVAYKEATAAITGANPIETTRKRYTCYMVCCLGIRAGRGNIIILKSALNDLYNYFRRCHDDKYDATREGSFSRE